MIADRYQGFGVGKAAIQCVLEELRQAGCPALHVTYHPSALGGPRDFYRKLGFVEQDTKAKHEQEVSAMITIGPSPK